MLECTAGVLGEMEEILLLVPREKGGKFSFRGKPGEQLCAQGGKGEENEGIEVKLHWCRVRAWLKMGMG